MRQCVYSVTLVFFAHGTRFPVIKVFRFLRASFSIAYEAVHDIMSAPRAFTFTTVSFLFPVLAYTRAAAIDALMLPFPVLAFLANLGHGGTDTARARPEQQPCF